MDGPMDGPDPVIVPTLKMGDLLRRSFVDPAVANVPCTSAPVASVCLQSLHIARYFFHLRSFCSRSAYRVSRWCTAAAQGGSLCHLVLLRFV